MQNIKMVKEGNILKIEIDLSKRGVKSKTGKSVSIATTSGNVSVPGAETIKLGLNCYTPAE